MASKVAGKRESDLHTICKSFREKCTTWRYNLHISFLYWGYQDSPVIRKDIKMVEQILRKIRSSFGLKIWICSVFVCLSDYFFYAEPVGWLSGLFSMIFLFVLFAVHKRSSINRLDNALAHKADSVEISCDVEQGNMVCRIQDNGTGI